MTRESLLTVNQAEFKPVIYNRYIDYTFLFFQNINQIETFKNYLTLQHAKINFTSEILVNNFSLFLTSKSFKKQQIDYLNLIN